MVEKVVYPTFQKVLHVFPGEAAISSMTGVPLCTLNAEGGEVFELCDGEHSFDEICKILADRHRDNIIEVRGFVSNFLEEGEHRGYVKFCKHPVDAHEMVKGSREFWVPTLLSVELTYRCNLKCKHCFIDAGLPKSNEMQYTQLISILDEFSSLGTSVVSLTGGEPLMHPEFFRILDFCDSRFLRVEILTNGCLIDKSVSRRLATYKKIGAVQVSLNGATAKTHDSMCGPNSFERATNAIALLVEEGMPVTMTMLVTPSNVMEMEDTIKLGKRLGVKEVTIGMVAPVGRARDLGWEPTLELVKIVEREKSDLAERYSHDGFYIRSRREFSNTEIEKLETSIGIKRKNCGAGYKFLTLSPTGGVRPCNLMFLSMGNVLGRGVLPLLKSSIVTFFHDLTNPNPKICGDCEKIDQCFGCHSQGLIWSKRIVNCKWKEQWTRLPKP